MTNEEEILNKYKSKLGDYVDEETQGSVSSPESQIFSKDYLELKQSIISKRQTSYENWCNAFEKLIQFKPKKSLESELQNAIETAHLDITPTGAASFAAFTGFLIILLGIIIAAVSFFVFGTVPAFTFLIFTILGLIALFQFPKLPIIIASRWRLKASNQMVLCILYVVIYMRHTSNLEHAIKFAAQHIDAPLSLDLKKIFWDLETAKYSTIKESLDAYLETWRHYNLEFVTAFHLIESSLYEPTESRRVDLLEKGLSVILEGSYEKMLHYAQDIKSPITTLHMLGVILPILGLVIFPLIGSFLQGLVKWYHLAFLYNLILPLLVYFLGINILSKRPTGYGTSKTANKVFKQAYSPLFICVLIFLIFAVIGLAPLIAPIVTPPTSVPESCPQGDISLGSLGCFFGYLEINKLFYGPFGLGALILSFFFPAGLALALGIYYKTKTKKIIELRNETKELESEFASALFQLGNRIGDGIPSELAFSKVSETLEGTPSGNFFKIVDTNIRQLGLGMEQAIFDEKVGAILSYPSPLIESSMEVLLESSKKGPLIVSQSLTSISTYVDRIHKVSERLKDLLAEVISSMKSQISFLTPMIAGIVVGISTMIIRIIVELNTKISSVSGEEGLSTGGLTGLVGLFDVKGIIPGYWFQLVVGFYVIQLAYILTILQNGIENGPDKINEQFLLSKNITRSFFLYAIIALVVAVMFTGLATAVLSGQ